MSAIITESTARRRYTCSWDCGSDIEPGQRYVRWSLPPRSEGNSDDHWVSGTAHGDLPEKCPTFIHGTPAEGMQVVEDEGHRRWRADLAAREAEARS